MEVKRVTMLLLLRVKAATIRVGCRGEEEQEDGGENDG